MQQAVLIFHSIVGSLFIVTVLMQDKGVGFGGAIGGTGGGTGFYATQRGAAKVIHYISIVLCVLFFVSALSYVLLPADEVVVDPSISNPVTIEDPGVVPIPVPVGQPAE